LKILVTGGAGFVGKNLVNKLDQKNYEVTVFDNLSTTKNDTNVFKNLENISFVKGDVTNKNQLDKIFKEKFDVVFHLSAIVGVSNYMKDPLKVLNVNVLGTKNIIECCLQNTSKLIFMSTSEIYGKNPKTPWNETDDRVLGNPQIDRWSYSTSKSICEHMITPLTKQKKLDATILRYFNLYGPWQNPIFVISQTIHKCMNNKKPLLYDSGKQTRCFTFVDDAVDATIESSFNDVANGQVFNIGNNVESTIHDTIKLILEETNKPVDFIEDVDTEKEFGNRYEDIPRRIPDVSKAKKLLNWEPKTQLREGIKRTIEWVNHNKWWLE